MKFKYDNGDVLRDVVSGFEGVVMVRAEYATGCVHYGLLSRELSKSGEPMDWHWFDESLLAWAHADPVKFDVNDKAPRGPMPTGPEA